MGELLTKLGIDWKLLLANTTTFFIILWLLRKYAFKPIVGMLEKRQAFIADSLKAAKQAKADAQTTDETRVMVLRQAKHEAAAILAAAEKQTQTVRQDILAKAKTETETMMAQTKQQLEAERLAMIASAREELAQVVVTATQQVIGEQLDAKLQTKLAKQALKEVPKP